VVVVVVVVMAVVVVVVVPVGIRLLVGAGRRPRATHTSTSISTRRGQGQVSKYRTEGKPLVGGAMWRCDRGVPEEVPHEHVEGKHVGEQAVAARGEHLGRRVAAPDQRDGVVLIGIVRGQGRKEGGGMGGV